MSHFSDPKAIEDYEQRTLRLVPGLLDMHRMATLLLAERVPMDGKVLIVGAGGSMEIKCFAQHHPEWRFDGVDPSAEMLRLARVNLGPMAARVQLHEGHVDSVPHGPFDGAACLLTLHFIAAPERRKTLQEIHRRLKPGSPFVVMHFSFGQNRTSSSCVKLDLGTSMSSTQGWRFADGLRMHEVHARHRPASTELRIRAPQGRRPPAEFGGVGRLLDVNP